MSEPILVGFVDSRLTAKSDWKLCSSTPKSFPFHWHTSLEWPHKPVWFRGAKTIWASYFICDSEYSDSWTLRRGMISFPQHIHRIGTLCFRKIWWTLCIYCKRGSWKSNRSTFFQCLNSVLPESELPRNQRVPNWSRIIWSFANEFRFSVRKRNFEKHRFFRNRKESLSSLRFRLSVGWTASILLILKYRTQLQKLFASASKETCPVSENWGKNVHLWAYCFRPRLQKGRSVSISCSQLPNPFVVSFRFVSSFFLLFCRCNSKCCSGCFLFCWFTSAVNRWRSAVSKPFDSECPNECS